MIWRLAFIAVVCPAISSFALAGTFSQVFNVPPDSLEPLRGTTGAFEIPADTQVNVTDNSLGSFTFNVSGELNYSPPTDFESFRTVIVENGGSLRVSDGFLDLIDVGPGSRMLFGGGFIPTINVSGGEVEIDGDAVVASFVNVLAGSSTQVGGQVQGSLLVGDFGPDDVGQERAEYTFLGGQYGPFFSQIAVGDRGTLNYRAVEIDLSMHDQYYSDGSTINFFGGDFAIDGVPIATEAGTTTVIADRDVTLSGLLEDGTPFAFSLITSGIPSQGEALVEVGATITVTNTIPEPAASSLATLAAIALACRRMIGVRSRSAASRVQNAASLRDVPPSR